MKFKRFEYIIKDEVVNEIIGSYTLKEGCSKEQELKKMFKSKLVQKFEA